ncbi:MAG: succinylglutamate desuccinylase/aspartoacylase family protein, partial [Kangiellaceae bacterium]|nr:succinylglutamate desuccinylase/aspartoacylase family protein [Kangiellaceae bacterium]
MKGDSDNHSTQALKHQKIGAIAVVGGTHGNELTGVHLIKHWQSKQRSENFISARYPEFQIETLLANDAAILQNKRYLEKDLNRCFKLEELNDIEQKLAEQKLAKKINF